MFEISKKSKNKRIVELLTFSEVPTAEEVENRVKQIVDIAEKENVISALIDCQPFLVTGLELNLKARLISPLFKFIDSEGNITLISSFFEEDSED